MRENRGLRATQEQRRRKNAGGRAGGRESPGAVASREVGGASGASEAPASGMGARSTSRAGAEEPESGMDREEDMDGVRLEADEGA